MHSSVRRLLAIGLAVIAIASASTLTVAQHAMHVAPAVLADDAVPDLIVGPGVGGTTVRVLRVADGAELAAGAPFGLDFTGGVRVAAGDVTGDGVADVIVGAGVGSSAVRVYDGATAALVDAFTPFGSFDGGVYVAAGDIDVDGYSDIIVGQGPGGGLVRIISGATRLELVSGAPFGSVFSGGVTVAAGDVTGDGRVDIVTATAVGGAVRIIDPVGIAEVVSGFPYGPTYFGGISVAAADVTGDGRAEVVVGQLTGVNPTVQLFDVAGGIRLASFGPHPDANGVSVAAGDVNGDGYAEVITGAGAGGAPRVRVFDGATRTELESGVVYPPGFAGGVFVATTAGGAAIRFTSAAAVILTVGTPGTFAVTTTGTAPITVADGTLPAGLTLADHGNGTATLAGTPAAGTGGIHQLTFHTGVGAGVTQSFTLTIREAPAITSPSTATLRSGVAGSVAVTTSGFPTRQLHVSGALPPGTTFVDNGDSTGTLSGTPSVGGTFPLTITASNGVGTAATQTLTVTVEDSAAITSASAVTFETDIAGSFTVTTAGVPAVTSIARGGASLPAGVTFTDHGDGTGTLSGTPAAGTGGIYPLTFTATNGVGASAAQSFTLTVNQPPAITTAAATTFTGAGTFTVVATGFPRPTLAGTGTLPSGVAFTDNGDGTGTLNGTPEPGTSGDYGMLFTAANGVGSATQSFTLSIQLPATMLEIVEVNGDANPIAGSAFSVLVRVRDSGGLAVVPIDTVVELSLATGTGVLSGTLPQTILAGASTATFTGVSYPTAESGVTITASRTSGHALAPATSAPFTVNAGPVASYELTPASNGVSAGAPLLITIQPRDAFGNATTGAAVVTLTGRNAANTSNNANVEIDADRNGTYDDAIVDTAGGATTFHVRNEATETFIVRAQAAPVTSVSPVIGSVSTSPVVISEFRFRGPDGGRDEYVVVSNTTDAPITVAASDASAGWALVGADGTARATIPNGTILPARGAYLITTDGVDGFSLGHVPAGAGSGTVGLGDATYSLHIPSSGAGAGVGLFRSASAFNATTLIDAVGYSAAPALFREGTGFAPGSFEQGNDLEYAFVRSLAVAGIHADTDNNVADFSPVDTNGTLTGNGQHLGMPGPRSTASPVRNDAIAVSLIPGVPSTVRDDRAYVWPHPTNPLSLGSGVLSYPRRFTNDTGQAITRLRVRITALSTFPAGSGVAQLRAIDGTGTVTNSAGTVIIGGLRPMLLENPQEQPNGGGIHSTLTLDVSQLPGGVLGIGESVDVHLMFGVAQAGTPLLTFIVEALP